MNKKVISFAQQALFFGGKNITQAKDKVNKHSEESAPSNFSNKTNGVKNFVIFTRARVMLNVGMAQLKFYP